MRILLIKTFAAIILFCFFIFIAPLVLIISRLGKAVDVEAFNELG